MPIFAQVTNKYKSLSIKTYCSHTLTRIVALLAVAVVLLAACAKQSGDTRTKPFVVATTGMIADAALVVGGELIEVKGLMGPGVDPHLYKATQGDLRAFEQANLILYNGLHLEGKLNDVLGKMKGKAVAVTQNVPEGLLVAPPAFSGNFDPHIWFDAELWQYAVVEVRDALIAMAPENKASFEKNAEDYLAEIDSLHQWIAAEIEAIPEQRRILITAHDAFGYFGIAYGIEVTGLQGISTVSEFGIKDVSNMVDLIIKMQIPAIFVESSVPKRSIEAIVQGCLAKGHQVVIGGELFSDAMGEAGTPEGTYLGMVRHNVSTIAKALK